MANRVPSLRAFSRMRWSGRRSGARGGALAITNRKLLLTDIPVKDEPRMPARRPSLAARSKGDPGERC